MNLRLFFIFDVVDEADRRMSAVNGDAAHYIVAVVPVVDIQQRIPIYDLEVFDLQTIDGIDVGYHLVVCLLDRVCLGVFNALFQRTIDMWRDGALLRCEKGVARALGEAVGVTDDRALHDVHELIIADIVHQTLHHSDLLPVLLTEISAVRLDDKEQTAHDLAYAIEMARALGSFHDG